METTSIGFKKNRPAASAFYLLDYWDDMGKIIEKLDGKIKAINIDADTGWILFFVVPFDKNGKIFNRKITREEAEEFSIRLANTTEVNGTCVMVQSPDDNFHFLPKEQLIDLPIATCILITDTIAKKERK